MLNSDDVAMLREIGVLDDDQAEHLDRLLMERERELADVFRSAADYERKQQATTRRT